MNTGNLEVQASTSPERRLAVPNMAQTLPPDAAGQGALATS
jgi:hypothetical protein